MGNKLIKTDELIKSDIGNLTINELSKNATKVVYENNKLNIINETDEKRISIEITQYPNGQKRSVGVYDKVDSKKDYIDTIRQMKSDGMTQREIAEELGLSQSYVSKLLSE
ncbi:helix-turn-helix domain-containing protein [Romboutsia sp. 1001216sp1]|uniref:helix-turn-helix domain-containing protein n=1 Tax=unclassified Romboutsia TaxID=2626894 RepID=UPI00189E7A0A|nr:MULTISPECIES: helix-turn-helix domain-containing protein [unclassified Romboutsia]MDB8802752.1 helix-turn-helix domain-containing protein [Romboutsia sp. 1001216sp1]MDB8814149.1 helix-turn-helix domain-containing protein [Romboutsia sp. 1001216sp1]